MWYSFMFGQMIRIIFKEDDQIYTKNKEYELNYRFNRHKKLLDAIEYDKMTVYWCSYYLNLLGYISQI